MKSASLMPNNADKIAILAERQGYWLYYIEDLYPKKNKMSRFKLSIFSIFLLVISTNIFAQRDDKEISLNLVVYPPSPNATAIAKFGEIPVSLYTGTPNITVPIYTINTGDISAPVMLSYHAGGFKMGELASNIGLGWALMGLGNISRTVRGIPDESPNGYLNSELDVSSLTGSNMQMRQYLLDVNKGRIDLQADIFQFNILGKSGKFFIDKATGLGVLIDAKEKIKIERGEMYSWTITDDKGFKYFFGKHSSLPGNVFEKTIVTQNDRTIPYSFQFASSWQLVRVEDTRGNYVNIEYVDYSSDYCQFNSAQKEIFTAGVTCSLNQERTTYDEYEILGKKVSKVSWKSGSIEFTYGPEERNDFATTDKRLSLITVKNNNSPAKSILKWSLEHSYFSSGEMAYGVCNINGGLRLDRIRQIGEDGSSLAPYEFTYNSATSSMTIYSQDYWGHLNGRNNSTMVPSVVIPFGTDYLTTSGADKRPDDNASKSFLLTSIKYPTGGKTDLYYEGHDAFMSDFPFESEPSVPMKRYAIVRKSDMNTIPYKTARFTVNATQALSNGSTGGKFILYVRMDSPCDPSVRDGGCGGEIYIESAETGGGAYIFGHTGAINGIETRRLELPNGTYDLVMEGFFSKNALIYDYADLWGPDEEQLVDGSYNKPIGGVRIGKIVSDAGDGRKTTKRYVYRQRDFPGRSSGVLADIPNYTCHFTKDTDLSAVSECTYTTVYATSRSPLSVTQGSHIGYKYVEEYYQDTASMENNGKTSFEFTTSNDYPDQGNNLFPFAPKTSFDMKRGLLKEKCSYKFEEGSYSEISKEEYSYELGEIRNLKNQYNMILACNDLLSDGSCNVVTSKMFIDKSIWVWLKEKKITTYSETNTLPVITETKYSYENNTHLLPTRIATTGSDNIVSGKIYKYPADYDDIVLDDVIKSMKNNTHQHNYPIEVIEFKGDINQESVTGSTVYGYQSGYGSEKWLSSIYSRKISSPVSYLDNNTFPTYNPINPINPNLFDLEVSYLYNQAGTIMAATNRVQKTSYLWDDAGLNVVAAFENANISDVAFSSFEQGTINSGNWEINSTPIYSVNGSFPSGTGIVNSGTIEKKNLKAGEYILSYWTGTSRPVLTGATILSSIDVATYAGRTFIKQKIQCTGSVLSISVHSDMDDLALYPVSATLRSNTVVPLLGIISETNQAGIIIRYEYDAFGRLSMVRDMEGNLLKRYCYNYAGQPEDCGGFRNQAQTGSFTRNNCATGGTGSTVSYTVAAGRFTSLVSQADANTMATTALASEGQAYANANGTCTFYSDAQSGSFTRNNCSSGYIGSTVTYTIAAGAYSSTVSKADANSQATTAVSSGGQAYANANGTCTAVTIYARAEYAGVYDDGDNTYGTVLLKFYSDAACTTPYSVSNLTVNYKRVRTNCGGGGTVTGNFNAVCNGTSTSIGLQTLLEDDGIHCWNYAFSVTAGTGYTAK